MRTWRTGWWSAWFALAKLESAGGCLVSGYARPRYPMRKAQNPATVAEAACWARPMGSSVYHERH